MVDLPAPIMPTSTTERWPSARAVSASADESTCWEGAGSVISTWSPPLRPSGFPILPLRSPAPVLGQACLPSLFATSCLGEANMLVVGPAVLLSKPVDAMPSLIRFLTVVGIIGGLIYGGIYALANFV